MDHLGTLSSEKWAILLEIVSLFLVTFELYSDETLENGLHLIARAEPFLAPLAGTGTTSERTGDLRIPRTATGKVALTPLLVFLFSLTQRLVFFPLGLVAVVGLRMLRWVKVRLKQHTMIRTISLLGGVALF